MDMDQILKRVQWMDDERRKDKDAIALMENRILALEGSLAAAQQLVKDLSGEISRLSAITNRMDQYDGSLLQQRIETKKMVEELERETKKREEEAEKVRRVEIKAIEANLAETKKGLEPIPRLEKNIQTRFDEDTRLGRMIDDLRVKIEGARRSEDDYTRTFRLLEDGRRQDAKRINDLIGEVSTLRKRADEQRGQVEVINSTIRRLDTRLQELLSVESERRDVQSAFLDRQNLLQVERDKIWKDWEARFQTIEMQAGEIESQLQKLEITHRETKRSQSQVDELNTRVDRRISEITEIQRLTEDRFRQEWITFKADDQKRWTNYTLIQEETKNETGKQLEKIADQITDLADQLQEEKDQAEQAFEGTEKRLQSLLALVHTWVSDYERSVSRR
ncbi:MAG: hypothetical protein EHM41_06845 [Chloroflexi bacterium]|nr:MAG: hypothetical protein EHM41_06845 [Chloroflexota bacterium]